MLFTTRKGQQKQKHVVFKIAFVRPLTHRRGTERGGFSQDPKSAAAGWEIQLIRGKTCHVWIERH